MKEGTCDLKVHINGRHIFVLNQRIVCNFSGKLRNIAKQLEKRRKGGGGGHSRRFEEVKFTDFPGGPDGFELAARFCYSNGRIAMNPSNICALHCSASFLEMTAELTPCNLVSQAETFLDGLIYWTWEEILSSIKTCEQFFYHVESSGLFQRLLSTLLAKISANSDLAPTTAFLSSSSSSPDVSRLRFSSSVTKTPDTMRTSSTKEWWFDDLTILHPRVIEKFVAALGSHGGDNRNLIIIRFLLQYLNKATARHGDAHAKLQYGGLADAAVHGVVLLGRKAFSCRGLFRVLRIVSGLGLSRDYRQKLECLMGLALDQATLDDLLVCGHGPAYDVGLVLRLVKIFVYGAGNGTVAAQSLKKVGTLLDMYLGEVSPDQSLKVPVFLRLAERLPDSARDCYDGVYRAVDIYLQTHPSVTVEDKARLCRCLNYEKLSAETCRDLAKNPRIPPRATVQALLVSQRADQQSGRRSTTTNEVVPYSWPAETRRTTVYYKGAVRGSGGPPPSVLSEETRLHHRKMKWKVVELENKCTEMKGHVPTMAKGNADVGGDGHLQHRRRRHRGLPKLC